MNFFRQISSHNGLTINFSDHTNRYFGDFFNVRIEAVCQVLVPPEHEAASILGSAVSYRRTLSRMAVPSHDVPSVIDQLIADFEKTTLPYISGPTFPQSLIDVELTKKRKKISTLTSLYGL